MTPKNEREPYGGDPLPSMEMEETAELESVDVAPEPEPSSPSVEAQEFDRAQLECEIIKAGGVLNSEAITEAVCKYLAALAPTQPQQCRPKLRRALSVVMDEVRELCPKCAATVDDGPCSRHWRMANELEKAMAAEPQLSAQEAADLRKAAELLEMFYDKWENGTDCFEDPEEHAGYCGKAVELGSDEEEIIAVLNRLFPRKP